MGQKTIGKTLASVCLWKVCIPNSCNWQIYLQNHDLNFRSVLHTNQNCSKIGTGSIHRNSKHKTIQVLSILVHRHSMFNGPFQASHIIYNYTLKLSPFVRYVLVITVLS